MTWQRVKSKKKFWLVGQNMCACFQLGESYSHFSVNIILTYSPEHCHWGPIKACSPSIQILEAIHKIWPPWWAWVWAPSPHHCSYHYCIFFSSKRPLGSSTPFYAMRFVLLSGIQVMLTLRLTLRVLSIRMYIHVLLHNNTLTRLPGNSMTGQQLASCDWICLHCTHHDFYFRESEV